MRKKKKSTCSCAPQQEVCSICNEVLSNNKTSCGCKKTTKKQMDCYCDDYELTCEDKCKQLAKQAEELYQRALACEAKATQAYEQAKECEKASNALAAKAKNL